MKVYRLNPIITVATRFSFYTNNGKFGRYGEGVLQPNEMRKLPDDDPQFVQSIIGAQNKVKKKYTKEIEDYLIENGVEYEITLCPTCGGKKRFVEYNKIVILDVDENDYEVLND